MNGQKIVSFPALKTRDFKISNSTVSVFSNAYRQQWKKYIETGIVNKAALMHVL